ncbi:MAG: fluoride efflux transporter CrcB [Pseudoxanthomonas sp.]
MENLVTLRLALLVGLGGALGSVLRWALNNLISQPVPAMRFPLGIFVVNVIGCGIAGVLAGLVERHDLFGADTRVFLFTGILGGFTTFSAFGLESMQMLRRGEWALALAYAAGSVVVGVLAAWLGLKLVLR